MTKLSMFLSVMLSLVASNAFANNSETIKMNELHSPVLDEASKELDFYRIIEPVSSDAIGDWIIDFPSYEQIIGYSSLGHVFLFSPSESNYAVYYPFRAAAKNYGTFNSISEFEKEVLQEEGFSLYVLNNTSVKEISELIGTLNEHEVYIPSPYPFLGGDESLNSYEKGNVWIMLDVVNQLLKENS